METSQKPMHTHKEPLRGMSLGEVVYGRSPVTHADQISLSAPLALFDGKAKADAVCHH